MMPFFDINNIAFSILNYPVSYVELIGTLAGLASVYYASRANILTWPTGIINEAFLFLLFFQVQLYADMFLQVFFFVVTIFGWYQWKLVPQTKRISSLYKSRLNIFISLIAGTLLAGYLFSNIHHYLPAWFKVQAAYPYIDSFIMVTSVVATLLLAKKKIENWYCWIVVDAVCVGLYWKKGVHFLSLEYLVFLGLASYGLYNWKKEMSND